MRTTLIKKDNIKTVFLLLICTLLIYLATAITNAAPVWALGIEKCEAEDGEPGCIDPPEPNADWHGPPTAFKWRLMNRANLWTSAWRSHDDTSKSWSKDTYDPNYVNPTHFTAIFRDQCYTKLDFEYYNNDKPVPLADLSTYRWSVDGAVQVPAGSCAIQNLQFEGQGIHEVKLEVFHPGDSPNSSTPHTTRKRSIRVRDYLVVLFGDSASSGEGSPETARTGANEYGTWIDRRCHRSTKAGVPKAVQKIEEDDPYTSITFLNFACSGATISLEEEGKGSGIIGPYAGIEPPLLATPGGHPTGDHYYYFLPSQIDQLANAIFCPEGTSGGRVGQSGCGPEDSAPQFPRLPPQLAREVDLLFMTGGINDVQFANLMLACTLEENCHNTTSDFYDNEDGIHSTIEWELGSFADLIPGRYVAFKENMNLEEIYVDKTYVLEYPNAFTYEGNAANDYLCPQIVQDVLPQDSVLALLAILDALGDLPILDLTFPLLVGNLPLIPYLAQELGIEADDVGSVLGILLDGATDGLKVDQYEVEWMNDVGTPALNGAVETGVEDVNLDFKGANFTFVGGIADKFFKHGYCAANNWIRRATQASQRQGPWNAVSRPLNLPVLPGAPPIIDPFPPIHLAEYGDYLPPYGPYGLGIQALTKGLMHPTDEGYDAIAEVLEPIMDQLRNAAPVTKSDFYKIDNGAKLITGPFDGVLSNDSDPNGDEIRAVLIQGEGEGPKHGKATLSAGGRLEYTPENTFKDGLDFLHYYVTDGAKSSPRTQIKIQVGELKFLPPATQPRWRWEYPTGEEATTVEIGGVAEFPVCNFCGDKVLRVNPEAPPGYGDVTFMKIADRWTARYVQNGEIPALLPYLDTVAIQIGPERRAVFVAEGSADIPVYINAERPSDWSWTFQNPEYVSKFSSTTFDVCENCSELVVRVQAPLPDYGTVALTLDSERGRWEATYTYTYDGNPPPLTDVISVEIGEQNAEGEFRQLGVSRITVDFSLDDG